MKTFVGTRRARLGLLLVLLALSAFTGAWTMSNVPFGGPDEAAHYLRAANLAQGHMLGPRIRYPLVPGLSPPEMALLNRDARAVVVPARLTPPNVNCVSGRPNLSGSCVEATYEGNFPPLAYAVDALAYRASSGTSTAMWLMRLGGALQSLAFLILAAVLLWRGSAWSVVGLLVAVTPMVLFVSSIINPSGVEIASSIAFVAAILRLSRERERASTATWAALAVSGFVAVVAWPLGLAFVLAGIALLALLLGAERIRGLGRQRSRAAVVAAGSLAVAAVIWVVYARVSHLGGRFSLAPSWHPIELGLSQLGTVLRQAVGTFGALTVWLPSAALWVWWILVAALTAAALWLGTARQRVALAAVLAFDFAFPVLFYAWFDRFTGFGLQGREMLPALVMTPLLAGEIVYRRHALAARDVRRVSLIPAAVLAIVAVFQGYAWWWNARVAAGAPGTLRFYAHATWKPPLGWLPWIASAAIGMLSLIAAAGVEFARTSAVPSSAERGTLADRAEATSTPV